MSARRARLIPALAALVLAALAPQTVSPRPATAGDPVVLVAGDIADCTTTADSATAAILDAQPGTIVTLGDNVYPDGSSQDFADCYAPTWGRHLARTRPAPGNHEYRTAGAAGYKAYFGTRARPAGTTWYAFDLGSWRVIVLDSNCAAVGGCGRGSAQYGWLVAELDRAGTRNVMAAFHHPRTSSGAHGSDRDVQPFWDALWEAGADLILNGHDHDYERFAPQDRWQRPDPEHGIRQFVVGTGGTRLRGKGTTAPNSQVFSSTHGVLRLTLRSTGYDWDFLAVPGATFTDAGSGETHGPPPPRTRTTVRATADTYVDQARPGTASGTRARLWTDGDTGSGLDRWTYIRFAVPELPGRVDRALLGLWIEDGTRDGPLVLPTSSAWSGRTLTWRTRPAATGPALRDLRTVGAGAWLEVDVTGGVREGRSVSFLLRPTSGNGMAAASIQGTAAPRLVVETVPD